MCRPPISSSPVQSANKQTNDILSGLLPLVHNTAERITSLSSAVAKNGAGVTTTTESGAEDENANFPCGKKRKKEQAESEKVEAPRSRRRYQRRRSAADNSVSTRTDKGHKRAYVQHDYHDFSHSVAPPAPPSLERKGRGGVSSMFPVVLHNMLEHAERDMYSHIVSWQPHGRSFHVHDSDKFVNEIMPRYFRHTRFSSFQRQLSLYGFTRLTRKGPDRGSYYHELFLRGNTALCNGMQRTRVKGTQVRQAASPETEPDFYAMEPAGCAPVSTQVQQYMQQPVAPPVVPSPGALINPLPMPQISGIHSSMGFSKLGRPSPQLDRYDDVLSSKQYSLQRMNYEFPNAWANRYGTANTASYMFHKFENSGESKHPEMLLPLQKPVGDETELAMFLSEVDLESGDEDCFDNEEGFARILERNLTQYAV